jgi:hypothetical protein
MQPFTTKALPREHALELLWGKRSSFAGKLL